MAVDSKEWTRQITQRTRGRQHGPVTRLIDPLTNGEALKPFVLLDYFDVADAQPGAGFGLHPHSGIATFTLLIEGGLKYEDSTGKKGFLPPGSLEWMRAAIGVWHGGMTAEAQRTRGFQLWVTLPRELELAPAESQYVTTDQVVHAGPARVTLGEYAGVRSQVRAPQSMNYLHVRLRDGQRWSYQPPAGHEIAWVYPCRGELRVPGDTVSAGELAIFEESNFELHFSALGDSEFVLGSAVKHHHELILGYYSIHSSVEALQIGAAEIERVGRLLIQAGKIDEERLQQALGRVRPGTW